MIKALNGLRRDMGLPETPTLTGRRAPSRRLRKTWKAAFREVRHSQMRRAATRYAMQQHQRMEDATPEEQRRIFEEGL